MKRTYRLLAMSAAFAFALSSCQDEVLVETPDNTNVDALLAQIAESDQAYITLNKETGELNVENAQLENLIDSLNDKYNELRYASSNPLEVHYTVNVLSAGNAEIANASGGGSRTKGVTGATVVVEQNGAVLQPSSNSNGLYLFKNLRQGYVYVTVSAPNHAEVEYGAYLYIESGEDLADADAFNASTQIVLYPTSGSLAGVIKGNAYANTSTLNDTLDRKYGTAAAFAAAIKGTYISAPGSWSYGNLTQNTSNVYVPNSVYGSPSGPGVAFETGFAGQTIYGIPQFNTSNPIPDSENGQIYTITYKNIVTKTTIAADGTYSLPVIASSEYDNNLIYGVDLYVDNFVAPHERMTDWDGNFYGQLNEPGSTSFNVKYFNNSNGSVSVFTGTGTTSASVPAGSALQVSRRKVSVQFEYVPYLIFQGSHYHANTTSDNGHYYLEPGQTVVRNIYYFPNKEK